MNTRRLLLAAASLFLLARAATAQDGGLLITGAAASSSPDAYEVRSYRQDNALYATAITLSGQRKQLRAANFIALLPAPPASFEEGFTATAQSELEKINALELSHPAIKGPLDQWSGKWSRALSAFEQIQARATAAAKAANKNLGGRGTAPGTVVSMPLILSEGTFQHPHLTAATSMVATFRHDSGLATVPLAELTAAQIVQLNRTSDKVQLPVGMAAPAEAPSAPVEAASPLTSRIEGYGRSAVNFCATHLGVSVESFDVWTFFVVLPGLVVLHLLAFLVSKWPGRAQPLPKAIGKR